MTVIKRMISFAMILAVCFSLPLVTFAAEPKEYIFEVLPAISLYDDYIFNPAFYPSAMYDGYIPEGMYDVYAYYYGFWFQADSPVSIKYEPVYDVSGVQFRLSFTNGDNSLVFDTILFRIGDSQTGLYLFEPGNFENYVTLPEGTLFKFVSVDNSHSSGIDTNVLLSGFALGLFIGIFVSLINKIILAFVHWTMSW